MSEQDTYNGWTNRETWAVALHINNDQGWQESVLTSLREVTEATDEPYGDSDTANFRSPAAWAGEIIRENVEGVLSDLLDNVQDSGMLGHQVGPVGRGQYESIRDDIGSMWRVNWTELGASFLEDLEDE